MKSIEELIALGSKTARNGFRNERDIAKKFNSWENDTDAKEWLKIMGYNLNKIEKVEAIILSGYKTDVQVKVTIYLKEAIDAQNISIKLVSNPTGFNQIDKRWVDKYVELWHIPNDVADLLKQFTGEIRPEVKGREDRRIFLDEMIVKNQNKIINFFSKNKALIIADIIKGRGSFSADWMMVALNCDNETRWTLKDINYALNTFSQGDVFVTNRGSLRIGKITMQRKGGDNGRPSANMLQFKINPVELLNK